MLGSDVYVRLYVGLRRWWHRGFVQHGWVRVRDRLYHRRLRLHDARLRLHDACLRLQKARLCLQKTRLRLKRSALGLVLQLMDILLRRELRDLRRLFGLWDGLLLEVSELGGRQRSAEGADRGSVRSPVDAAE